jgi:hypothetical protein
VTRPDRRRAHHEKEITMPLQAGRKRKESMHMIKARGSVAGQDIIMGTCAGICDQKKEKREKMK